MTEMKKARSFSNGYDFQKKEYFIEHRTPSYGHNRSSFIAVTRLPFITHIP